MASERERETVARRLSGRYQSLTRREVLRGAGLGLSGGAAALLVGCGGGGDSDAEAPAGGDRDLGPPEVTTIRMPNFYGICVAPTYLAKPFLLEEGFTDVRYNTQSKISETTPKLSEGTLDMALDFAAPIALNLDAGLQIVALAGLHVGCFELFARADSDIQSVVELRGKTVGISQTAATAPDYAFMQSLLSYVGIMEDEYTMVASDNVGMIRMLSAGEVDAVLAYPPFSNQLRTLTAGRLIYSSMKDTPASQYGCCLVLANREFREKNPIATKRALRAILKGADVCAREPERAARYLVDEGYVLSYDYALDAMQSIPYDVWRGYDPEDTLRHYALRLNEAKVITSTPEEIIKKGTDWTFLDQLRTEMAYVPPPGSERRAFALNCVAEGREAVAQGTGAEQEPG